MVFVKYPGFPKLPRVISADDALKLWLSLFSAETEEDLTKIEELGVSVMKERLRLAKPINEPFLFFFYSPSDGTTTVLLNTAAVKRATLLRLGLFFSGFRVSRK
jgi:hypothetical protein